MFSPEQPIKSSAQDLLGRNHFAEALSQSIITYSYEESIVIGLYGQWGSGKTSLLNLVTEKIKHNDKDKKKNKKNVIIRFNPWNFSDQNQLIGQFFKELSLQLKRKEHAEDAIQIGQKLEIYSQFFLPLALIPQATAPALLFSQLFRGVGKSAKKWGNLNKKDLFQIRSELDSLLRKLKSKIIIIIDDVDRLNNTEIRQIFQLIKSLGDFPNTIYMVAFDKNIIINALKEVQKGSGEEYLEKMIQIPFEIPPISQSDVEKLLFTEIDKIIKDIPQNKWDNVYWGNIYHSGIKYFFKNLRDVTRYINLLRFGFNIIKTEVNPIDFIALTCLQVFTPNLYSSIRSNKELFTGTYSYSFYSDNSQQKEKDKAICDNLFSSINEDYSTFIQKLIIQLFPKLSSLYSNINYGYDRLGSWRKDGRICSPDVFDIFFKLQLPENEVSALKLENILINNFSKDKFKCYVELLTLTDEILRFLERAEDYTSEDISIENIRDILDVLYDLGDTFPDTKPSMFNIIDTPLRICRLTLQLLKRIDDKKQRFSILDHAFDESQNSISVIVECISILGHDHGKFTDKPAKPIEEQLISLDSLNSLEFLACQKIKTWIDENGLFSIKNLPYVLFRLRKWEPNLNLKNLIQKLTQDDMDLISFVESFLSHSTSQGFSDYVAKVEWRMSIKSLKEFIDVDAANNRLEEFKKSDEYDNLNERHKLVLNTFLDTYSGKIKNDFDS